MRTLIAFVLAFSLPCVSIADAAKGQFMGYQLGSTYERSPQTEALVTTNGNLKIIAEDAVKPTDVGDVTLVTTPDSLTIGYISSLTWFDTEEEARAFGRKYIKLLRAKYPGWAFGREEMDANMRAVEVNLDKPPYNLQMRLTRGDLSGKTGWRISMTLRWLPDTEEAKTWRRLSHAEQATVQQKDRELLLDQGDTRGL